MKCLNTNSSTWLKLATFAVPLAIGGIAIAQVPGISVDDIVGLPSKVKMHHAIPGIRSVYRRHKAVDASNTDTAATKQKANTTLVQNSEPPPRTILPITHSIKLTFVDEVYLHPIASLPVKVTIVSKGYQTIHPLVTDALGCIQIADVGPIPAAVNIDVNTQTTVAPGEPEWQLADPQLASILIDKTSGDKVPAVEVPYRVASIMNTLPRLPPKPGTTIVYQVNQTISLKRNLVDFQASLPDDASVYYPDPNSDTSTSIRSGAARGTFDASGELQATLTHNGDVSNFTLPAALFDNGPIPLAIHRETNSAVLETIVTDYTCDPYKMNDISIGPLTLVAIKDEKLPHGIDVLNPEHSFASGFGQLKIGPSIEPNSGGANWWTTSTSGLFFRTRTSPFSKTVDDSLIDRIRVIAPNGGSVGGISVGSSSDDVAEALGAPQSQSGADGTASNVLDFLDHGLQICVADGHVKWIEVRRPRELLTAGTTAFVPREAARLFVSDYIGNSNIGIDNIDKFKDYLGTVPSIRLVDSQNDAELVLSADADFNCHMDSQYKYMCETKLSYRLIDQRPSIYKDMEKESKGSASADYSSQAQVVQGLSGNNGLFSNLLRATTIQSANKSIQMATNKCPAIAATTAFGGLVQDINVTSDFSARVTAIDYDTGVLTLNVGTTNGVHVSRAGSPYEFELMVGKEPLPYKESDDNSADYYTAVVIRAADHECDCELHHVNRRVVNGNEKIVDKIDRDMLLCIPDPATGIVSARASVRFPEVEPVITDDDIADANNQQVIIIEPAFHPTLRNDNDEHDHVSPWHRMKQLPMGTIWGHNEHATSPQNTHLLVTPDTQPSTPSPEPKSPTHPNFWNSKPQPPTHPNFWNLKPQPPTQPSIPSPEPKSPSHPNFWNSKPHTQPSAPSPKPKANAKSNNNNGP